ncbi:hypothetical protein BDW22DRAFT_1339467, partial [Trametopsis cervina]
ITSAGEKQHYALALLQCLFRHIPDHHTVGVLYDIGCQLHRSCIKWGFLPQELPRITFSISVLHAYRHQWPCQLIYHPRKCAGFGLSDGEGCERFWSMIRKLIPMLRTSSHHQRLFLLDTQVHHIDGQALSSMGSWLSRKWKQCQTHKLKASEFLRDCGVAEDTLCEQWDAQVEAQTRLAPRRSRNQGKKTIDAILELEKTRDTWQRVVEGLEEDLERAEDENTVDVAELTVQLYDARQRVARFSSSVQNKKQSLGLDASANLTRMKGRKYLQLRVAARSLKH